jgi:hypothetical protein
MSLSESIVEDAALEWFGELGYSCLGAEALTPALSHGERKERSGGGGSAAMGNRSPDRFLRCAGERLADGEPAHGD